ncbi:MAG: type II secretion system minor pseudopilin GspH [Candidatus Sedimenticola endophacoides]
MLRQEANPTRYFYSRGFTLLEIVVVVFLIGLLSTFTVLSISDGGQRADIENEASRIDALLRLGGEEAIVTGEVLGLGLAEQGYRFFRFREDEWRPLTGLSAFREQQIPHYSRLSVFLNNKWIALEHEPQFIATPQILFYPNGEVTSFRLILASTNSKQGYQITVQSNGEVIQEQVDHAY